MLLQLPLELQQRVVSCLTTSQALELREVSRECKDLASSCIGTARLSSVGDLKQMTKSFPNVTDLSITPESLEDVQLLFDSFFPDPACCFPSNLRQLSIDTARASYGPINAFQVDMKARKCTSLNHIQLSAFCINLTADEAFLQRLVNVQAVAERDPDYPPACFLGSGIVNADALSACSNLRVLKTYTRTWFDTQELIDALPGCSNLTTVDLTVPYVHQVLSQQSNVSSPHAREVKLVQKYRGGTFAFDFRNFPAVEFLVISLPSQVPEGVTSRPMLDHLLTAWLHNVTNLLPLRDAPRLTTLSLNYSEDLGSRPFQSLREIPRLQRLEICDHTVHVDDLLACRALREVVLVDVIDVSEVSAALYIHDLASRDLQSVWVQSEGTRFLFPTETFEFSPSPWGRKSFAGWKGRVCKPAAPAAWFENGVTRSYELGLQLIRTDQLSSGGSRPPV